MKKYLLIAVLFISVVLTSCTKASNAANDFSGKTTDLSKHYLSEGYIVNMYRSMTPLGDDYESLGKAYVTMSFQILTEYTSTYGYSATADYNIQKVTVTNVRILETSKMGMLEDLAILKQYSQTESDPKVEVKSNKSKYELTFSTPGTSGVQSAIWVNLNKIALYDEMTSQAAKEADYPSLAQVYGELGIDRNEVAFKIGFRVELLTVGGKTLYKDYEIVVPPAGVDITADQFSFQYIEEDTAKMKPFLEKE